MKYYIVYPNNIEEVNSGESLDSSIRLEGTCVNCRSGYLFQEDFFEGMPEYTKKKLLESIEQSKKRRGYFF